jgi:hypothetical protein
LSTKILLGQERRVIGSGWILIGLSQETSHWAEIRNPDNVQQDRTKSGRGSLWSWFEFEANPDKIRRGRTMYDWAGQCPVRPDKVQ